MRPKFFDPGGLVKHGLLPAKKQRQIEDDPPEESGHALDSGQTQTDPEPLDETFSDELKTTFNELEAIRERQRLLSEGLRKLQLEYEILQKIAVQEQILKEKYDQIAKIYQKMREEEEMLIFLLLHDDDENH